MSIATLVSDQERERAARCCEDILRTRQLRLSSQITPYRPRRHYASALSTCPRQLVYNFVAWDKKTLWDAEVQAGMEDGKYEQQKVWRELSDLGYEIVEAEQSVDDERLWTTGRIDGKIKWDGKRIPIEIKRLHPGSWDAIESVEDFKRRDWTKRYLAQLYLYLYLHNEPIGIFILSNGIGGLKLIPTPLDLDFLNIYTQAIDQANASPAMQKVKAGQESAVIEADLPARIPFTPAICNRCAFKAVCLPNATFGEGAVSKPELEPLLAELETLEPSSKRYDQLRKELKEATEGQEVTLAGEFAIEGRYVTRVYKAQPAKPARETKAWEWEWKRLTTTGTNGSASGL